MIKLTIPDSSGALYAKLGDYLVGPIGSTSSSSQSIDWRSPYDSIDDRPSVYGENDVTHIKFEGNFTYNPIYSDKGLQPVPTKEFPRAINWNCRNAGTGQFGTMGYLGGVAQKDETVLPYGAMTCIDGNPSSPRFVWCSYRQGSPSGIYYLAIIYREYSNFRITGSGSSMRYTVDWTQQAREIYNASGVVPGLESPSQLKSTSYLMEIFNSNYGTVTKPQKGSESSIPFTFRSAIVGSMNIQDAQIAIDRLCNTLLETGPITESVHFGELAEKASQKVNANQVNMIAFIADLKNPKAMIPKLKNLTKLKDLADDYLAINYGVLPTIDDLKSLYEAFTRHKPYIDKNGFKTYHSSRDLTGSRDSVSETRTQRIKLAISDNDEGAFNLSSMLDNIGFLPTFENLWDLIPYSFVIDWFLNVGDILERVDTKLRLLRLPIKYVTMSNKVVRTTSNLKGLPTGLQGNLNLVLYSRWTSIHCPVPPLPSLSTDFTADQHLLEGSALLIQRAKTK